MRFVAAVTLFLAVYNNATNLLDLPDAAYVPVNMTVAAALVVAARRHGYRWETLGLAGSAVVPGFRWGAVGAVVLAAALLAALRWPAAAPLLADQRVAELSLAGLAWRGLVRIPLGTVVLEEVAFRGVLLGAWSRYRSMAAAVAGSSAVFGLWHVGPSMVLLAENDVALDPAGLVVAVGGAVAVTAAAGVVFSLLRLRTGGILGPALVHWAANALGTVAAFVAQRA